jgi:transaldolase / glucose-6-phosphate isomerase
MSPEISSAAALTERFLKNQVVSRIWNRDPRVWNATPGSADERSIQTRLGWLDIGQTMAGEIAGVRALADEVRLEGVNAVYLLGMGGSSLCAEVMRSAYGVAKGYPDLYVLDTTDEAAITHAANQVRSGVKPLFLVSSKSGGTVEVASLERFFWSLISSQSGSAPGRHFVAITDPGTALQALAESKHYRARFLNPADIGGRFSALSLFGLVPAGLIGIDPAALLKAGTTMADGCRQENHTNPGLELGAFIGASALAGRNKLTVVLPPSLASLGLWIEQLIAESTGKHGKGALPVVDEPLGRPDEYGNDRAFVAIVTDRDAPDGDRMKALEQAGHPVLHLSTRIDALGAEFFRWEFATAIAGAALGINPFDEPNVAEAKEQTKTLLSEFASSKSFPEPPVAATGDHIEVYSLMFTGGSPAEVVRAALTSLGAGDYAAFLSYLPATSDVEAAIADVRRGIRAKYHVASTFGVGPRYLHSTGQYHKGGPNKALAFVITGDDNSETPIPEAGYSFAILKRAQALGDIKTLAAHERRVVRLHITGATPARTIEDLFVEALS